MTSAPQGTTAPGTTALGPAPHGPASHAPASLGVPPRGTAGRGAGPEEHRVEAGARWVTTAAIVVGALNYAYALVLTRLLDVEAYATFAAGQALVLCAGTVAVVVVPWILAQELARARTPEERADAVRFALVLAASGAVVAAAVVSAVAAGFAGAGTVAVLAGCTLLVYLTRVTVGRLQGDERMRTLACVSTGEAVLKLASGLVMVAALGMGATGALAAAGIGVLPFLFWWPRRGRIRRRPFLASFRASTADRDLWRKAFGTASVQGLIALMAATDVVLVTVLPADPAASASYQAAVMVGRVPLYVAGALAIAFFPALARSWSAPPLTAGAVRMYVTAALPLALICATVPGPVLTTVFPPEYALMGDLLPLTAISGLALGAVLITATFSQAVGDFRCVRTQGLGLLLYVVALFAGWYGGGVIGLAAGAAAGNTVAAVLLGSRLARRQGRPARGRGATAGRAVRSALPFALLLVVLLAARAVPALWPAAAVGTGLWAAHGFFRRHEAPAEAGPRPGPDPAPPPVRAPAPPSVRDPAPRPVPDPAPRPVGEDPRLRPAPDPESRPARSGRHAAAGRPRVGRAGGGDAARLLAEAVWHGTAPPAGDGQLERALVLARRNQTAGGLARAYPRRLAAARAEAEAATGRFWRNLGEAAGLLRAAGVPVALIKAEPRGDHTYGNFDLVVLPQQWRAAHAALSGWYTRRSVYWLERSGKVLLVPPDGPAAHLHDAVAWFGVPVVPADRLLARAVPCAGRPWRVPCPPDRLRVWLAHALFQNLSLDLSELLAVRELLVPDVIAGAELEAVREGWPRAFRAALDTAAGAVDRLDRGLPVPLPLPLPAGVSLRAGAEHAGHLLHHGHAGTAAREAGLRVPLVVAKRLRRIAS
ncbi:lipopolysaccharide biosynthesis protein [Streptomyces filamentosus]|uniref:lipopolysaccharide biosynthesis protein n=3 Tax=Streptomyces filamentosus TaxID=67294 RepID=UPI0033DDF98A